MAAMAALEGAAPAAALGAAPKPSITCVPQLFESVLHVQTVPTAESTALKPGTARPASAAPPTPELTLPMTKQPAKAPLKPLAEPALSSELLLLSAPLAMPTEPGPAAMTTADQPAAPDPQAEAITPQTSPEVFLNWLDALKRLGAPAPPRAAEGPLSFNADAGAARSCEVLTQVMVENARAPVQEIGAALLATAPTAMPAAPFTLTPLPPPQTQAPQATQASPPLAMDAPEWPQQLGEQIQWRLGAGLQEARIEISPRELGAVEMRLSVDDDGLRVHLTASHPQTRELLQSELPRLREILQQGGILLADAEVGRESPGRDAQRPSTLNKTDRATGDDSEVGPAAAQPGSWRGRNGLLDDYA